MTKRAPPPQIPRGMIKFFASENERIEAARKHLINLIQNDPAYRLAAIRLKRPGKLTELLADTGGTPSLESLASGKRPRKEKASVPGRPLSDGLKPYRELLQWIDRQQRPSVTLIDWCRAFVRHSCPESPQDSIEIVAKAVHRKLLDLRRRERNSTPRHGG